MNNKQIKQLTKLTDEAKNFLDDAAEKLNISARAYMKIVKVSRTIADLEKSKNIEVEHVSEALQFRRKALNL